MRVAAVAGVVLMLAAAGCGGHARAAGPASPSTTVSASPASPSASPSTTPSALPSVSPSASSTPVVSSSPPRSSSAPLPPACTATQLHAAFSQEQGGVGHLGELLDLTNVSAASCLLRGYAGLLMLAATHAPMHTVVRQGSGYLYEDPGPSNVVLAPGAVSSAGLEWDHIPSPEDDGSCPTSSYLQITPPGASGHLVLPAQIQACNKGQLQITAMQAGSVGPNS